jgi:riboflavin kinase/FMN adenylyltransferase
MISTIDSSTRTAITIGNFDGVHLGHTALIEAAREAAGETGRVLAITFEPHPATILRPGTRLKKLMNIDQRRQRLLEAGAEEVITLQPTRELLNQTPAEFIGELAARYRPAFIIEGPDFRFGRGRAGTVSTLRQLEATFGYQTIIVEPVEASLTDHCIVQVSSSMTRWLIEHGRVGDAARLLGRPYELWSTVVKGDQRGRTIGFPTANLQNETSTGGNGGGCLLPADGIYAGMAQRMDGNGGRREYVAAISVGTKPTFGGGLPRTCEAYLLDYDGPVDDYGWEIQLQFHHWLRDQIAFISVGPLVDQLHRDVEDARQMMMATHACV